MQHALPQVNALGQHVSSFRHCCIFLRSRRIHTPALPDSSHLAGSLRHRCSRCHRTRRRWGNNHQVVQTSPVLQHWPRQACPSGQQVVPVHTCSAGQHLFPQTALSGQHVPPMHVSSEKQQSLPQPSPSGQHTSPRHSVPSPQHVLPHACVAGQHPCVVQRSPSGQHPPSHWRSGGQHAFVDAAISLRATRRRAGAVVGAARLAGAALT